MPVPRYRVAIINWIAIYPLITLILWIAQPLMRQLPLYVGTLIISLALTATMNFLVMPLMTRTFRRWLHSGFQLRATGGVIPHR